MSGTSRPGDETDPLDRADESILEALAAMWRSRDPVPPGLADRARFAVALHEVEVEVARIVSHGPELVGARSTTDDAATSLSFATREVTVSLLLGEVRAGLRRVDGWLAAEDDLPPDARVHLQVEDGEHEAAPSAEGRFSFPDVPVGMARLALHVGNDVTMVTPTFEI